MQEEYKILTGNDACVLGAIAAGMNFFAGYPITPASEMAELASELLPKHNGKFMQMEDELASAGAIIGASLAGGKSMTATSGPGFSLMQENIGLASALEIPCVFVDVMRQGPAQGVATVPAQGDFMQIRWGAHGDRPVVAVAPCSVSEMYRETIRAFNMAEKYRTPVVIISDAILAHMSEKVKIPDSSEIEIVERKHPTCSKDEFLPGKDDGTYIPPMATYGDGYNWYITSIVHDDTGFPVTNNPELISSLIGRQHKRVNAYLDDIQKWEEYQTEDADIILVSVGLVSRSVKEAVDSARKNGLKVGLFRPITLWPFPEERLAQLAQKANKVICCEMNEGQLIFTVKAAVQGKTEVYSLTQNNGKIIEAKTILNRISEVK